MFWNSLIDDMYTEDIPHNGGEMFGSKTKFMCKTPKTSLVYIIQVTTFLW